MFRLWCRVRGSANQTRTLSVTASGVQAQATQHHSCIQVTDWLSNHTNGLSRCIVSYHANQLAFTNQQSPSFTWRDPWPLNVNYSWPWNTFWGVLIAEITVHSNDNGQQLGVADVLHIFHFILVITVLHIVFSKITRIIHFWKVIMENKTKVVGHFLYGKFIYFLIAQFVVIKIKLCVFDIY